MCIIWCLLANKYYETINNNHKSEVSTYKKYFDEIKQPNDIIYPIDIQKDISKFEKLNNIKINVFEYDTQVIMIEIILLHNIIQIIKMKM